MNIKLGKKSIYISTSEKFEEELKEKFENKAHAQKFLNRLQFAYLIEIVPPAVDPDPSARVLVNEGKVILFSKGKLQRFLDIKDRWIELTLGRRKVKDRKRFKEYLLQRQNDHKSI